ncbi:hypothetical protein GCM10010295_60990 [Streptomyces intermedius]
MAISHNAAVLTPQKKKQGQGQPHTEHMLGLTYSLPSPTPSHDMAPPSGT